MVIINHHYSIPFIAPQNFKYTVYDGPIGVLSYQEPIERQLPLVINLLNTHPDTRQAVIVINSFPELNSCMISMQFQIVEKVIQKGIIGNQLYTIVNFRSQRECYKAKDSELICYVVNKVLEGLKKRIYNVTVDINVGNAHS